MDCILKYISLNEKYYISQHWFINWTSEICTSLPWELLYADNLVLITDMLEECNSKLKAWKTGMESKGLRVKMKKTKFLVYSLASIFSRNRTSNPVLSALVEPALTPSSAHSAKCGGSTRNAVASLGYWWQIQVTSAPGVVARLSPSTTDQWLKWMSRAPCLVWTPVSATLMICCAFVVAVTVPLPPDVARPEKSLENSCLSSPPVTCHQSCVVRCTRPASVKLCSMEMKRQDRPPLTYTGSVAITAPWSAGPVAPKTKIKHARFQYSLNLALRILW